MFRSSFPHAASVALTLALTGAAATPAAAQIAAGSQLTFSGTATATDLGYPGVLLDFVPEIAVAATGNTGTFASLNRRNGTGITGGAADFVVGLGPQFVRNVFVIGGYRFNLTALPAGVFGQDECYTREAAPGQTCTPYQSALGDPRPTDPLSPFYLANVATGDPSMPIASVVAFNLIGTVTGPGGATSPFAGVISTILPGSYQAILGGLEQAGAAGAGIPGIPFTGRFVAGSPDFLFADQVDVAVTPEPGTVALLGAGLVVVGGAARRRRR